MSVITKRRVARKLHICESCEMPIRPGHVYLEHTLMPGNDIWDNIVPVRAPECSLCAIRYGRGELVA